MSTRLQLGPKRRMQCCWHLAAPIRDGVHGGMVCAMQMLKPCISSAGDPTAGRTATGALGSAHVMTAHEHLAAFCNDLVTQQAIMARSHREEGAALRLEEGLALLEGRLARSTLFADKEPHIVVQGVSSNPGRRQRSGHWQASSRWRGGGGGRARGASHVVHGCDRPSSSHRCTADPLHCSCLWRLVSS